MYAMYVLFTLVNSKILKAIALTGQIILCLYEGMYLLDNEVSFHESAKPNNFEYNAIMAKVFEIVKYSSLHIYAEEITSIPK